MQFTTRREFQIFAFPTVFPRGKRHILRWVQDAVLSIGERQDGETHSQIRPVDFYPLRQPFSACKNICHNILMINGYPVQVGWVKDSSQQLKNG